MTRRPATGSGRVIGVRAGDDEVGADVTIVAEGVLGLTASGAGLREQPRPADHALGFKEVVELPAGVIEDRWHLNEGEGATQLFMGEVTRGMTGGGFLYTNRNRSPWASWSHGTDAQRAATSSSRGSSSTSSRRRPRSGRWCAAARSPSTRLTRSSKAGSSAAAPVRRRLPAGRRGRRVVAERAGHGARHGPRHRLGVGGGAGGPGRPRRRRLVGRHAGGLRALPARELRDERHGGRPRRSRRPSRTAASSASIPAPSRGCSSACSRSTTRRRPPWCKTGWRGARTEFLSLDTLKDLWSLRKV